MNSMTREEFRQGCLDVRNALAPRIIKSTSSITRLEADGNGYAHGTGNYIKYRNEIYLLTNEHVISSAIGCHLGHIPGPTDYYLWLKHHATRDWPYDVAISRLTCDWKGATKIPLVDKFDTRFQPVPDEVLFFVGYPGTKAERFEGITKQNMRSVVFNNLISPARDFMGQVHKQPIAPINLYDPNIHFPIGFPAVGHVAGIQLPKPFPNPQGLSGSLVWDTKFIASNIAGEKWSPEMARICGIIWFDYTKEAVLLATKVEHLFQQVQLLHKAYPCAIRRLFSSWI